MGMGITSKGVTGGLAQAYIHTCICDDGSKL